MASAMKSSGGGGSKGKVMASSSSSMMGKVKSEGGSFVPASRSAAVASVSRSAMVKEKTTPTASSKTVITTKATTVRGKSQKKVYTLPGQKFDIPEEREPLRIFYESLSKQIPSSEMAEFWLQLVLMEHGMLSPDRARKAHERKQRRQQQLRNGTPIKTPKFERSEPSRKPQPVKNGDIKAKKRVHYSDDDDDFIVKRKKIK